MYRNKAGYSDPTAGEALGKIMKEYRQQQKKRFADKNRKKVYVASRYAGDVGANTRAAVRYCRYVIKEGCMPIAAHLLYPQMLDDNNPVDRELGLAFGLALLNLCDEVWVFGPLSRGMAAEVEEAKRLKKPLRCFKEG